VKCELVLGQLASEIIANYIYFIVRLILFYIEFKILEIINEETAKNSNIAGHGATGFHNISTNSSATSRTGRRERSSC